MIYNIKRFAIIYLKYLTIILKYLYLLFLFFYSILQKIAIYKNIKLLYFIKSYKRASYNIFNK